MSTLVNAQTDQLESPAGANNGSINCYQLAWLTKYAVAKGEDLAIQEEEMSAFGELSDLCLEEYRQPVGELNFLDVGTCTGRYLAWAIARGFHSVQGIDNSPEAISFCRRKFDLRAQVSQVDVMKSSELLKIYAGLRCINIASMMFGTINHFSSETMPLALRNVASCVVDDGSIIFSSWLKGRCPFSLYDSASRRTLAQRGLTLNSVRDLAARSGLRFVDYRETTNHIVSWLRPG